MRNFTWEIHFVKFLINEILVVTNYTVIIQFCPWYDFLEDGGGEGGGEEVNDMFMLEGGLVKSREFSMEKFVRHVTENLVTDAYLDSGHKYFVTSFWREKAKSHVGHSFQLYSIWRKKIGCWLYLRSVTLNVLNFICKKKKWFTRCIVVIPTRVLEHPLLRITIMLGVLIGTYLFISSFHVISLSTRDGRGVVFKLPAVKICKKKKKKLIP